MRIAYLGAHSVLEYDEVRLFSSLGHDVFSIGAYIHPSKPLDDIRPALPDVPEVPECIKAVDALGQQGHADTLMAAKDMGLPDEVLDWAEVIIVAAMEYRWLIPHVDRFKGKRVIWRTIGQSGDRNEQAMSEVRNKVEIVRYSPKEWNIPSFAGSDALIRFYKDPDDYGPWVGDQKVVTNVTQKLRFRSLADDGSLQAPGWQWTSYGFWDAATRNLPKLPAGPGSEQHGGLGNISFGRMKELLASARAYLFTGTQPASYTLGFMEALMTGIPLVSIGPSWMKILPYGSEMFEAHELAPLASDDPELARKQLKRIILDDDYAKAVSKASRHIALETFGQDKIAAQWASYLDGAPVPVAEQELVAA